MSLINQMLNNLDARRADGSSTLHRDIRPLPAVKSPAAFPWLAGGGIVATIAVIAGLVYFHGARSQLAPTAPLLAIDSPGLPPLVATTPIASSPDLTAPPATVPPVVSAGVSAAEATLAATQDSSPIRGAGLVTQPERMLTDPKLRLAQSVSLPAGAGPAVAIPIPNAASSTINPSVAGDIDKTVRTPTVRERSDSVYRTASALVAQGKVEVAAESLRATLREDPKHRPSRQLLLKLLLDGGAYDELRTVLQDGLESLPQQIDWALLLSRLLIDRGDAEGSLRVLLQAESQVPSSADLRGAAGAILFRSGSEAKYVDAVRLEPEDGRWMLGYALVLDAQGKTRESREGFRRARAGSGLSAEQQSIIDHKLQ